MNNDHHLVTKDYLTLLELRQLITSHKTLQLSEEARKDIQSCREYLDKKLSTSDSLIYGINTGFGSLCNTAISKEDLSQLQFNLVRSHACGMERKFLMKL